MFTRLALATLLAFGGSASAVFANSHHRAAHRGPVSQGRAPPTVFYERNVTIGHSVKPFHGREESLVRQYEPSLLMRFATYSAET
jgi:hypothetical protein